MVRLISISALCALCCFLSGCGCSKDKPTPAPRMEDADYTNRLVQIHGRQKDVAANAAAIRGKIEALGAEAKGKPEYVDLTNRLAQCEAEMERIRQEALLAVRARISKDLPPRKTGDLKK